MTSAEEFARLGQAFDEIVELEAEARRRAIERFAAEHPELRARLEEMLRADASDDERLQSPGIWMQTALRTGGGSPAQTGRTIGAWRLIECVGEGGMGVVYRAERADGSFDRQVALKLLRASIGSGGPASRQRFERERRILAELSHEHVAQLLDAGVSDDGIPWFAMEFVEGESIERWCASRRASIIHRVQLLRDVASAVAAAHRLLIVHRDLKPSNILVDRDGNAKLLDFGIAKLLDPLEGDATQSGMRLMTPRYAAPEQILGHPVSTATDVYALGALAYELLAERPPFAASAGSGRELEDAILAGHDAPLPKQIPGDLRNVVEKAMRREAGDRYASADAFAEDLRRYLEHEPLRARPATLGYRMRRAARRHRAQLLALSAVFLALAAGLIGTTWQAQIARSEAVRAQTVSTFLRSVFETGQLRGTADPNLSARELLDHGRRELAQRGDLEPALRADLLLMLGQFYNGLSQYEVADSLYLEAESLVAAGSRDRTQLRQQRALTRLELGSVDLADSLIQLVHADNLERHGDSHPETDNSRSIMATLASRRGNPERAVQLYREVLENGIRHGTDEADRAICLANLGVALDAIGRSAEGDSLLFESLRIRERLFGERHPVVAINWHNLASTAATMGDDEEALRRLEIAISIRREKFPRGHVDLAGSLINRAQIEQRAGNLDSAEATLQEATEILQRLNAGPSNELARAYNTLGTTAYRQGDYRRAAEFIQLAIEGFDATLGPSAAGTLTARNNRAVILHRAGALDEAAEAFAEVMQLREDALGVDHPDLAYSRKGLGLVELDRGNFASAEEQLRIALDVLLIAEPEERGVHAECQLGLGRALLAQSRLDEAEPMLREAEAEFTRSYADSHPLREECRRALEELQLRRR